MADIHVYGASWCPDCLRAKKFLTEQRVPFDWFDIERNPRLVRVVEERNDGKHIIPTVVFADGSHLSEPTNEQLADKLGLVRIWPHDGTYEGFAQLDLLREVKAVLRKHERWSV